MTIYTDKGRIVNTMKEWACAVQAGLYLEGGYEVDILTGKICGLGCNSINIIIEIPTDTLETPNEP
jgi:hypothetical protein